MAEQQEPPSKTTITTDTVSALKQAVNTLFETDFQLRQLKSKAQMTKDEMQALRESRKQQNITIMKVMLQNNIDTIHSQGHKISCGLRMSRTKPPPDDADNASVASSHIR